MAAPVLIVGQGLAGTALGLACEDAGVEFVVADAGPARAASRAAAGLVNPVSGRRWAATEDFARLAPLARAAYDRWGARLGAEVWRPLALVRRWSDEAGREAARLRLGRGELAPWVGRVDADGVEVRGAARVDLSELLDRSAARWRAAGRLRMRDVAPGELEAGPSGPRWRGEAFASVVLATGAGPLARALLDSAPLVPAKGEVLAVAVDGWEEGRAALDRHWLVGTGAGQALVGATFERGREDLAPTAEAAATLAAAAGGLAGAPVEVRSHRVGVRLTTPDRRALAGWLPRHPGIGVLVGLGSKGALWAPELAGRWAAVLAGASPSFPAATDPARWIGRVAG